MASSIGDIVERITEYIQIKTEQVKLKIIAHVSRILANVIALCFIVIVGFFFMFFLSFSVGSLLNEVFESEYLGHLTIAGFYLLLILIIFLLMKSGSIQNWFENIILNIAEKEDEQED
ncbi:MAG: hypothetical protein RIM99_17260 [Cyclobacteriaceae bacterium]